MTQGGANSPLFAKGDVRPAMQKLMMYRESSVESRVLVPGPCVYVECSEPSSPGGGH